MAAGTPPGARRPSPLATATEKAAESSAKKVTKPKPTKRTGATSSKSGASTARARKAKAKATGRKVARYGRLATSTASGRSGSLVGLLVLSLALVLLYNVLAGAQQLAGFLGGIQRAIAWLVSPTATIPFKEQ